MAVRRGDQLLLFFSLISILAAGPAFLFAWNSRPVHFPQVPHLIKYETPAATVDATDVAPDSSEPPSDSIVDTVEAYGHLILSRFHKAIKDSFTTQNSQPDDNAMNLSEEIEKKLVQKVMQFDKQMEKEIQRALLSMAPHFKLNNPESPHRLALVLPVRNREGNLAFTGFLFFLALVLV